MVRVLIVAGDAVEAQEIFYPYWRLREEGFEVHVAAPSRKALFTVVHDFEPGWVDRSFEDVDPEEYDGLVIPGGRMPEFVRLNPALERVVKHFFEAGKPVAAICHGPLILAAYGLLRGRVTSYIAVKPDVVNAGASWEDSEVVVEGNLVTSRAWPDLPAWMREFIKLLRQRAA